jgi:hypothetical protein
MPTPQKNEPLHIHNGVSYAEYVPPAPEVISREFGHLESIIKKICTRLGVDENCVRVSKYALHAIYRVDQRKLHYKMYRTGMVLGELNEVGLMSYWLLRYRPIVCEEPKIRCMNEIVSFYLIVTLINVLRKKNGLPEKDFSNLILDALYTFGHRAVTYDSMTLFVKAMYL